MEPDTQPSYPSPVAPAEQLGAAEDTFVHFNGRQAGPYSLDHVRNLVHSGGIPDDALAWRIGQPDWQHVGTVIGTKPLPAKTNPGLGIASFCIGLAGVFAWFVLLAGAGFLAVRGTDETGPTMVVLGLLMILGTGINLVGIVFAVVALCRKDARKALSVAGLTLNTLQMIAFVALIIIGTAAG